MTDFQCGLEVGESDEVGKAETRRGGGNLSLHRESGREERATMTDFYCVLEVEQCDVVKRFKM